ncbi:TrmH family RNA methyltransferase [Flavisolibacter ginsenosidimutans]|uniref:RNA methyltransferase n=1 Tax=Flavisolibacter ginsenosidimutans TaxID=661481 RepID=A0A5B8UFT3_9BACT|nr:RNA methyltransferase [Flavisolibacter ginsenosidimutans]QEC55166.1 RNA methyltransferase [Flavisolibacter ginsenosidimutans]
MLSKKVIKDIQSLGLKKYREETGLFLAEGPKIVEELSRIVPAQIEAVYATASWNGFAGELKNMNEVSEAELGKLSQLKTPNQVLAVLRQFPAGVPDTSSFTLYLDAVQDPGNFGTIVRIADWFGVKQIVCSKGCADLYNPKVVQATMASVARVTVFYDEEESWLRQQSQTIYAAALNGKILSSFSNIEKGILIIGNESKGIREEFLQLSNERITIPRRGEAESLNAAVATGIILSHLLG